MLLVWLFCSEQMILFIRITDENFFLVPVQSQEVLQIKFRKMQILDVLLHIKSQHGHQSLLYTLQKQKVFLSCFPFLKKILKQDTFTLK